jgi:hypothetical protein
VELEPEDRFLRDLNPDLHFKPTAEGYRLTSAVFRDRRIGGGLYACSVDSERIAGNTASEARAARGHGDWGVGRVSLQAVQTLGEGDVRHDPEGGNGAHCTLTVRGAKARALALACEVTIEPTSEGWVAEYGGRRNS